MIDLTPQALPPEFLARYEVLGTLGEGGVGFVLEVRDRKLDRRAAAKFLRQGLAGDPQMLARFRREARLTAALSHPSIVRVYDLGVAGESPYIVYELVEGSTLREILESSPPGLTQALRLMSAVLDGLQAAHNAGVVHRDLKPENLLLASDGVPRIADFGIARSLSGQTLDTSKGFILGTPAYLAPEVLRGEDATPAADLYAAGAILFELIYGRQPFVAPSLPLLLQTVLAGPPELPPQPPIPAALARLLSSALAQQPEQRPGSAGAFAAELRTVLDSLSLSDQPQAQTIQVKLPRRTRLSMAGRRDDDPQPPRGPGATQTPTLSVAAAGFGPRRSTRLGGPGAAWLVLAGLSVAGVLWWRAEAPPVPAVPSAPLSVQAEASPSEPSLHVLEVRRGSRDLGLTWRSGLACRTAVRLRAVAAAASVLEQSAPGPETTEHRQTVQRLEPGKAYLLEPMIGPKTWGPGFVAHTLPQVPGSQATVLCTVTFPEVDARCTVEGDRVAFGWTVDGELAGGFIQTDDRGLTWSEPRRFFAQPDQKLFPELWLDQGRMHLFWLQGTKPGSLLLAAEWPFARFSEPTQAIDLPQSLWVRQRPSLTVDRDRVHLVAGTQDPGVKGSTLVAYSAPRGFSASADWKWRRLLPVGVDAGLGPVSVVDGARVHWISRRAAANHSKILVFGTTASEAGTPPTTFALTRPAKLWAWCRMARSESGRVMAVLCSAQLVVGAGSANTIEPEPITGAEDTSCRIGWLWLDRPGGAWTPLRKMDDAGWVISYLGLAAVKGGFLLGYVNTDISLFPSGSIVMVRYFDETKGTWGKPRTLATVAAGAQELILAETGGIAHIVLRETVPNRWSYWRRPLDQLR